MMTRPLTLGLALSLGLALAAGPGPARATTAGFGFLRLGSSARTAALGEAVTALESGAAGSYNPGALSEGRAFALTHAEWVEQIRHDYVTANRPLGNGVASASLQVSHADGLERRTGPSATALGEFGVYEWAAGLTWARPVGPRLRLGGAIRALHQSIYDEAASGVAADAGLLYRLSSGLVAGAAVRHLGAMGDLDREATDLPMQVRAGVVGRPGDRWLVSGDLQWTRGADTSVHAGLEGRVSRRLVLRAGYQTADGRGLSAGLGLRGRTWSLGYAYVPLSSGLGDGHRLSLSFASP